MTRNLIGKKLFILAELQGLNFKGFAQPMRRVRSVIHEGKGRHKLSGAVHAIGREPANFPSRSLGTGQDRWWLVVLSG